MMRTLIVTGLAILAFVIPAWLTDADKLRVPIAAGIIVGCLLGLARWLPAAIEVWMKRAAQNTSQGILGVCAVLVSTLLTQINAIVSIGLGRPDWWRETDVGNATSYLLLIAVVLFVTSTRLDGERPSRLGKWTMSILAIIGGIFGMFGSMIVAKLPGMISLLSHVF